MTHKMQDIIKQSGLEGLKPLVSQGILSEGDLPHVELYARERYLPLSPSLVLQYLAFRRAQGPVEVYDFKPILAHPGGQAADAEKLLEALAKADLLDKNGLLMLRHWAARNPGRSDVELLAMSAAVARFGEFMQPEHLLAYMEDLRDAKVVVPELFDRWHTQVAAGLLQSPTDLLALCRHAVVVDTLPGMAGNDVFLEALHRKTASVLAQLHFKDFSWEWVLDAGEEGLADAITVQLNVGGQYYRMLSHIDRDPEHPDRIVSIDAKSYYRIFNKALLDLQSPYRLHHVPFPVLPTDDVVEYTSRWGIIALQESQVGAVAQLEPQFLRPFITLSEERFQPVINTDMWRSAFQLFEKTGLFDHLTPEQIFHFGEQAFQQYLFDFTDFLGQFPDIILHYDGESGATTTPYCKLLTDLSGITHGRFVPEDMAEETDEEDVDLTHLSFTIKGKYYSGLLQQNDTTYDEKFWKLVQRANAEMYPGTGFYNVATEPGTRMVMYLTQAQADALHKLEGFHLEPMHG
jgi:hypothetical protein